MIVEARGLRKTYAQGGSSLEVLRGVDLALDRGESLAIVGPSGGGKSTLLSILSGIEPPTAGELWVDGQSTQDWTQDDWTRVRGESFGIVYQQFHLVPHLTALENVHLPLEIAGRTDWDRARGMLADVGLQDRAEHRPSELSGGEVQRVAIARALILEPKIILADEPSGNLDPKTAKVVMDLLFSLAKKHAAALVLVTHNHDLASRCDRARTLEAGVL